jgi:uncharacterized integral membrane protein (TIGR00698 family)
MPSPVAPPRLSRESRFSPAVIAGPTVSAALALVAAAAVPMVSALMWGLLAGALAGNLLSHHRLVGEWANVAKTMLRLGIVLLGLQLSITTIARVGVPGVVIIVATVAVTFTTTRVVGRRLGLDGDLVTLVAAGFSICGAAAVAAVQDAVGASQRHVSAAVALVTLFGTAAMFFVPWAADFLRLGDEAAAVWAGASIHEVAQVVAASSMIGPSAYAVASGIKLGRVVLLAPVAAIIGRGDRPKGSSVPWFVTGFLLACVVGSTGVITPGLVSTSRWAATALLAAGMFGLGLGLTVKDLLRVRPKALVLAGFATLVALVVPLLLILMLL